MKTRKGFVSNSSSSSFIIQGIVIEGELGESLYNKSWSELNALGIKVKELRDYFSDDEPEGYLVGIDIGSMCDGVPTKIKQLPVTEVIEVLKKVGIHANPEEVSVYVQFISNDNY